jgi:hypothetical protein
MFPVVYLEGVSHAGFMDSSMLPSAVKDSDLVMEIEEKQGHQNVGTAISSFIKGVESSSSKVDSSVSAGSSEFFAPFLEGLELEGSYALKEPCYGHELLNPDSPKCMKGSPWSQHAQELMAGDLLEGTQMKVNTTDNFHRVYTVTPVHLPEVDSQCNNDTSCTLQTTSVTEAYYERLDSFDTGKYEIGAVELKAKLMSR